VLTNSRWRYGVMYQPVAEELSQRLMYAVSPQARAGTENSKERPATVAGSSPGCAKLGAIPREVRKKLPVIALRAHATAPEGAMLMALWWRRSCS